ncbi:MAG: hypothetical protein K5923_01930 [Clostridia bacterium]|nr:hypothetical protein [Clostridia bacterium]
MNTNLKEQQTQVAIKLMETMDLYKPYIKAFKEKGIVTLYEDYAGFYIEETEQELLDNIKEFEKEHDCLVYAVTHEYTQFGECYDYLIVPKYEEEWSDLISYSNQTKHVVFAYVVNKDDPWCSEFGDITVNQFGGGLVRVA